MSDEEMLKRGIIQVASPNEIESCDDVISRQAAIDTCLNGWNKDYKEIIKEIRALPPVTPTEKVGHWIKLYNCSNSGYYCSECQKRVAKEGWSDTVKIIKYCPNCGAKMQEVEDNE